ncbi:glycerol-3-phosphate 1-O-acyltransferase PlsY [Miltoncostaea marina]|uniref:glycerol-3-phosphate 1-O-acyltransferase PlsY n=1 Tax=Miltoncostaea marina TaxID=2843215 RepID=UPI001C3E1B0E|nr:glycerol-3-phosphate 1-O-acyltransferase PlsY [Miltoncostaea marina]
MSAAAAIAIAYLLGSIPFAYLAGMSRGIDLRTVGSGNLGAANVFRALGTRMGVAVMAADIGKGVVAVLVARAIADDPWPAVAAGAAMAGHVFPVWLRFKGGKGVAVGGGAVIGLMPLAAAILLGLWFVVLLATRYSSLASITGAAAATPLVWSLGYDVASVVFTGIAAAAVLALHRANIGRLLRGEENRIVLRRRPGAASGGSEATPPGGPSG